MLNKNELIDVINEFDGDIYAPSANGSDGYGYKFEKRNEEGEPSVTPVPFGDIQFINNRSTVFKDGTLTFSQDIAEEVYKSLNIFPERNSNYFTREDIEDIILRSTDEKIQKIIDITNLSAIEKFRAILTKLTNTNEYDIIQRVADYINARAWELSNGKVSTQIKLIPKKKVTMVENEVELGVEDIKTKKAIKKSK